MKIKKKKKDRVVEEILETAPEPDPTAYHPKYDVYRDGKGFPVTITEEQGAAILHALRVWYVVRKEAGYWDRNPSALDDLLKSAEFGNPYTAQITKSCLLARMLYEGRPPMAEPPPVEYSAPAYYKVDPDMCSFCGAGWTSPGRQIYCSLENPDYIEARWCRDPRHQFRWVREPMT